MDIENIPNSPNVRKNVAPTNLKPSTSSLYLTPGKKTVGNPKSSTTAKKPNPTLGTKTPTASRPKTATSFSCSKVANQSFRSETSENSNFYSNSILSPNYADISLCSTSMSETSTVTSVTALDSREAAKMAKLQSTQKNLLKVSLLKEKWAKEKQQKLQFHKEKREYERRKLQEDSYTTAEMRRKQLEKQRELEEKQKIAEKQDILIRHEANLLAKQELEKQKQAKRRISIFLNNSIRKKAVEKQKELENLQKQQEIEDFTLKRMDFLTQRQIKALEEMERRESLHKTLEESKVQKEKEKELMNKLYHEMDKDLLNVRYENWKDEKTYKMQCTVEEQEEIQRQIEMFREQREIENKLKMEKELENINLLKTKELNWKDEQLYKQSLKEEELNEIKFKLNQWKLAKDAEKQMETQKSLQSSYEFELTKQANNDIKAYKEKCKEDRRMSLQYRLDKARKDKDFEKGLKAAQEILDEEEKRIADLDRQDVANYKQKVQEARRQSLEYRAQTEYQERMRKEGELQTKAAEERADFELRTEAWRDVQNYRELERQKEREDLAWRMADAHRQHELDISLHQEKLSKLHLDLQCKREDWIALQDYKKEEANKRRKSIQFRLDSWRQQRLIEENKKMQELMVKEEDALLREMDREELLAAKLTHEMMERHNLLTSEIII